ncbi:hypothetical protein [Alishewanella tabrizica]|nr:hypothetical protein [Alishewanella tabrizica]
MSENYIDLNAEKDPQVQAHIIKLSFDVKRFAKVFLLIADKASSRG